MRELTNITPTRWNLYNEDKRKFYKKYQADTRWPEDPTTPAMMVGSAFDYYIKQWLVREIGERGGVVSLGTIVLPPDDWACEQGRRIMEQYIAKGGGGPLLEMGGWGEVELEYSLSETVGYEGVSVPLYGKPDLKVVGNGPGGPVVIHDWKVNGGAANKRPSPTPGYTWRSKDGSAYKLEDAIQTGCDIPGIPQLRRGTKVGGQWWDQLCIYGWISGVPVGEEFIASVDQLCSSRERGLEELVRHRYVVDPLRQIGLYRGLTDMWVACQTGDYLSKEERDLLDQGDKSGESEMFKQMLES